MQKKNRLSLSVPITFLQRLHLIYSTSGFVQVGDGHPLKGIYNRKTPTRYRLAMPYLLTWALTGSEDRLHRWAELDKPKTNPERAAVHFSLPAPMVERVNEISRGMAADYKNNSHRAFPWYVFSRMVVAYLNEKMVPIEYHHQTHPRELQGTPVDEFTVVGLPTADWRIADGGIKGLQKRVWMTLLEMAHRRNLWIAAHPACPKDLRARFRAHATIQGTRITAQSYREELAARSVGAGRTEANHVPIETRREARGFWSAAPTENEIRTRLEESGDSRWLDARGIYAQRCPCPVPTWEKDTTKKPAPKKETTTQSLDEVFQEYSGNATA